MTLIYVGVAWTAGIAIARAMDIPWQVLLLFGLSSGLILFLWRDERRVRIGALCALVLAAGAGRYWLALPRFDEGSLATYNETGPVTLEGLVVGEPDVRDRHVNLRVRAQRVTLPDGTEREVRGLVLVSTPRYPQRQYGDRVRVEGKLETPQDLLGFSYRDYLARRNIHSVMWSAHVEHLAENQANPLMYHLLAFKQRARESIAGLLPEPQAALLSGILLGVESGIPDELMDSFSATGTTHIIAISGFNVTILAGIFTGLAQQVFDRRRAVWAAVAAIVVYTLFVGASAAVVRAALMGLLYLFGRYLGRPSYAPVSLAAAVIGMTAWNPHVLWDLGFLLSFAATAGLMLYTEPLERACAGAAGWFTSVDRAEGIARAMSDIFLVTVAAQITTAPLLVASFGQLSLVTLLTNALILPVQAYVMITGGIAALAGLILRPAGRLLGWVAWVFLTYTIEMVRLTGRIGHASVPVEMDAWMVWTYYGLLGAATWWLREPRERRRELWGRWWSWLSSSVTAKVLVAASGVVLMLALFVWRSLPDGRLHVVFFDVGQGDAIFIQTPSGRQVLIDGGPDPSVVLSRLGRRMPFWDRSLDLVVLTHPDADHIGGLVSVLERYRVDGVIFRDVGCESPLCEQWARLVDESGAAVYRGEAGLGIEVDEGLRLEVLQPGVQLLAGEGFNDKSLVIRLTYGEASVLLTGDIEERGEAALLATGATLTSTVLKVAHHGSCDSTTAAFVEAVNPDLAVISVGAENEFGLPCDSVVERLEGRRTYFTHEHGTVSVITDGQQLWVRTERGGE